ncbi:SAV_2336 N-terminal domain-related protein [Streptomyces sp. NPDC050803]|uniref:SAV_2336 N-terminal domain-related protein n=1 Tax=unclassified Streptomyces TaxID=2593676 RepID=UPI0034477757
MDEELAKSLRHLLVDESDASAEDLADLLWVARFAGRAQPTTDVSRPADGPERQQQPPVTAPAAGPGPEGTPLHAALPPRRDAPSPLAGRRLPDLPAAPVRLNRESSSADLRALARALRPLKRRVRSSADRELDEEATARATGETSLLLPVWTSGKDRHFEVDLVIDTGPSMVLWRQLASDVESLLKRQGAFRVVRTLSLDTADGSPRLSWSRSGPPRSLAPDLLADPTGRRIILLLTDGMGPHWSSPALDAALHHWSRIQPVAVLQVLPHRLWHRTRLTTESVSARPGAQGNALFKSHLRGRQTLGWVPVLELAPDWVEPWAKTVAGTADGWTPLLALPVGHGVGERQDTQDPEPSDSPEKLVERFRGEASASAYELAGYLAAAPLVPPVMHLVQRAMMPGSRAAHLAEVFLSGLIVPAHDDSGPADDPDLLLYDFRPGVRELLLGTLTRRESLRVLDVIGRVSGKVAQRFGGSLSFRALVPSTGADGGWRIPVGSAPFARVAAGVLASFGGEHKALAEALTGAVVAPVVPASGGAGEGRSRALILDLARAATVSVYRDWRGVPPFGSGFFVAPGWVLTSAELVPKGPEPRVWIRHVGRMCEGIVEWVQPHARYGSMSVPGLALVRLSEPTAHTCVWLSERTPEAVLDTVTYVGRILRLNEEAEVTGRSAVSGRVGSGGVLRLGDGAPAPGIVGGPVIDMARGEVIGVLSARGRDEMLMVPVAELRRESGDLYQRVVRAHDSHHAERPREAAWGGALSDIGNAGRVLTPDQRIELLGLLAQLPPPESTASLERLLRWLGGTRWYTLAPRAWRDGAGLLYDIPGVGGLEAVLRYAVCVANEDREAVSNGEAEQALRQWALSIADRTGLPPAFRRMLAEESRPLLRVPRLQRTVLADVQARGWEPDRYDWSISLGWTGGPERLAEADGVPLADLPAHLAAPLAEAFRRCDEPGRPATLEVALPANLLSLDIDAWRLEAGGTTALGAARPVVVRYADRQWEADSRQRWATLHSHPPVPTVFDRRLPDESVLRALRPDAVPVLCTSDDIALQAVLRAGHPIALWRRKEEPFRELPGPFRRGVRSMLDGLATAADLPSTVLALRRDLAAHNPEAYWSHGLTLMYDDPTSPIPGYDVFLEAP